jgi:hypothetical protein
LNATSGWLHAANVASVHRGRVGLGVSTVLVPANALSFGQLAFTVGNALGALNPLQVPLLAHFDRVLFVKAGRLLV